MEQNNNNKKNEKKHYPFEIAYRFIRSASSYEPTPQNLNSGCYMMAIIKKKKLGLKKQTYWEPIEKNKPSSRLKHVYSHTTDGFKVRMRKLADIVPHRQDRNQEHGT